MTDRKPAGVSWESWTERLIEEGRRAGAFDGLAGAGRPIDGLDEPHDDEWWIKSKLRREQIDALPPTIAIRHQRDVALAAALAASDEVEARRILDEINDRIRYVNSHTVSGPPSTVWVIDVEEVMERRRQEHPPPASVPRTPPEFRSQDRAQRDERTEFRVWRRWWRRG